MNASHATTVQANKPSLKDDNKPGFRTKTIATRLTPDELTEVESAAEQAGKPLSEWLRETALKAARQRTLDRVQLLLAELWAVRYALLNLFHAGAEANAEGKALAPESVLEICNAADTQKLLQARKLMEDSLVSRIKKPGN